MIVKPLQLALRLSYFSALNRSARSKYKRKGDEHDLAKLALEAAW